MTGKEVIRAAQMFTKNGAASRTSVVKEIVIGSALGLGFGLWWQVSLIIQYYSFMISVLIIRFDL